ncbi:WXG100 family type VII secretion target [Streptomyces sp. P38-E01]|uniref:WXG100 family type VII secretion target n=1 Tax=Streptomyces tardus TaxID=2780544 RepID=A0A949JAC8_9ACTN|nr:WXG100 family type VII secretion target [Streptomyces tardus]MBU7596066.1 WXG100 family type VII secretion target [Streptomyces tardus]
MSDRNEAVQALREAARGWRELGARVDETVQALDRQVGGVLTGDWRGSGAEGFAGQWALLCSAVQEAVPAFELAAGDLEQAADAAEQLAGDHTGAGDAGIGGDQLAGNEAGGSDDSVSASSLSRTEAHGASDGKPDGAASTGGDSTSALDGSVGQQLGAGLTHGSLALGSDLSSTGAPAESPSGPSTAAPAPGVGAGAGPGGSDGDGPAAGVLPTPMNTESVVSALAKLAATIATVFERTGGGGAGAGVPALPTTPYDPAFLRRSEGMLGESTGAEPIEGGDPGDGAGEGSGDRVPGEGRDGSAGGGDSAGSRIDSDLFPDTGTDPGTGAGDRDRPDAGNVDPEGADPEGVDPAARRISSARAAHHAVRPGLPAPLGGHARREHGGRTDRGRRPRRRRGRRFRGPRPRRRAGRQRGRRRFGGQLVQTGWLPPRS